MIRLVLLLLVLGGCAYLAESAPIDGSFKVVIRLICIVAAIWILLAAFGIADVPVPRLR